MDHIVGPNDFWMLLLPILVPYVTAAIKKAYAVAWGAAPSWLGPFKALLAGAIISSLAKYVGVPLPSDLSQLTDSTTAQILSSAVVIGAIGALIRNQVDTLKKRFGPETLFGRLLALIAGAHDPVPIISPGGAAMKTLATLCLAPLIALALLTPAPAAAAAFTSAIDTIPSRALVGYTFASGLSDPGEAAAFNFPLPGLVVSYHGARVLELGTLNAGLSGIPSADATADSTSRLFGGPGFCLLEGACGGVVYVGGNNLGSGFKDHMRVMATIDVVRTTNKLLDLVKTGIGR